MVYNIKYEVKETERSRKMSEKDKTITFSLVREKEKETRDILIQVYQALKEKGYNPINQIVGYILSEDPTYITNYKNARGLIRKIDRDELLNTLVREYLKIDKEKK